MIHVSIADVNDFQDIEALCKIPGMALHLNGVGADKVHLIAREEGLLLAYALVSLENLSLHNKILEVGYMHSCFSESVKAKDALVDYFEDVFAARDLIVMASESVGIYDPVVWVHRYNIQAQLFLNMDVSGIIHEPSSKDCVELMNQFTNHFTGYFLRDQNYYDQMKRDFNRKNGRLVGVEEDGVLVGYIAFVVHPSYVEVLECVYLRSGVMMKLLSYATRQGGRLVLDLSPSERLHKIMPDVPFEKVAIMGAKIKDKELFERLYHIKIISEQSGFYAFGKPLFNRIF